MGIQPDPAGVTEPAATAAPTAAVAFSQSDLDRARDEGRADGLQAGADAERARIRAVEAQALPGHEALIADMKFDGKTTGPEAAVRVASAAAAGRSITVAQAIAQLKQEATHG